MPSLCRPDSTVEVRVNGGQAPTRRDIQASTHSGCEFAQNIGDPRPRRPVMDRHPPRPTSGRLSSARPKAHGELGGDGRAASQVSGYLFRQSHSPGNWRVVEESLLGGVCKQRPKIGGLFQVKGDVAVPGSLRLMIGAAEVWAGVVRTGETRARGGAPPSGREKPGRS